MPRVYDEQFVQRLAAAIKAREGHMPIDLEDERLVGIVDVTQLISSFPPKTVQIVGGVTSAVTAGDLWSNNQKQVLLAGTTIWAIELGSNLLTPGYSRLDLVSVNLSLSAAGMVQILMIVMTDDAVVGGVAMRNVTTGALHSDAQALILSSNPVDPDAFAEGAATTYGTNTRRLRRFGVPPGPTSFQTPGDLVTSITPAKGVTSTRLVVVAQNLTLGIGAGTIGMECVIRLVV